MIDGGVIAIDAAWGEGKSWFGKEWAKSLLQDNRKVVFIDAFEQDYVEDPFLLVAGEIGGIIDEGGGAKAAFIDKASEVGKAILPLGAKIIFRAAGRVFLGVSDLPNDLTGALSDINAGVDEKAEEWVRERLKNHEMEKTSLQHFREQLRRFAEQQEKPVIVFVDELDRCKPTFAVEMIERIKHFFEVPNLVFVLSPLAGQIPPPLATPNSPTH